MPHDAGTPERQITFRFPAMQHHVPAARNLIQSTLDAWGVKEDISYSVTLSASELVTNAVKYCKVSEALFEVDLYEIGGSLYLGVSDPGEKLPILKNSADDAESGRGLRLVSELSNDWSIATRKPVGKTVFARFELEGRGKFECM